MRKYTRNIHPTRTRWWTRTNELSRRCCTERKSLESWIKSCSTRVRIAQKNQKSTAIRQARAYTNLAKPFLEESLTLVAFSEQSYRIRDEQQQMKKPSVRMERLKSNWVHSVISCAVTHAVALMRWWRRQWCFYDGHTRTHTFKCPVELSWPWKNMNFGE